MTPAEPCPFPPPSNADDGEKIVPYSNRDGYWARHSSRKEQFKRFPVAATRNIVSRFKKWWGLNVGHAIFQSLYFLAVLIGAYLTFTKTISLASTPATGNNTAAVATSSFTVNWTVGLASLSAVVIFVYKAWTTSARRMSANERDRRAAIAALVRGLQARFHAERLRFPEPEARLNEVCEVIRREVQEFLQISENSISVVFMAVRTKPGLKTPAVETDARDKVFEVLGRNRPRNDGWTQSLRPVLASYAFEAVRLRRTVVFHDVRSALFRQFFPDRSRPYRTVYCMPTTFAGHSHPYGVVTVNLTEPYALWPLLQNKIDQLLVEYEVLLNVYASPELTHANSPQLRLFND